MQHEAELIRSYGRCATGRSQVYRPSSVDEVKKVFDAARSADPQQRVVIRGGGHSFDGQAVQEGDEGSEIVLSSDNFDPDRIEFGDGTVTLGAGVTWGRYLRGEIDRARASGDPIRLPGSIQTGEKSTVAGTLSGDCLSRFSGVGGKESAWIESFRILTPKGELIEATEASNSDLFHATIGGLGYLGFVTDATYRLIEIDAASVARSTITLHETFHDLIQKQRDLIADGGVRRAISSAWFIPPIESWLDHGAIKGGVFDSFYAKPSQPALRPFPLYHDVEGRGRYVTELLARFRITNVAIHELLFYFVKELGDRFEDDLFDFLFFMDGNALAKKKFEREHPGELFPIEQQTFVVPTDKTEEFALESMRKARDEHGIHPTECDMLLVKADRCLMSANYELDGFAITIGFEPLRATGWPPPEVPQFFRELSEDCAEIGGRIHLTKNVYAERDVFRRMFSPQIAKFEEIKRAYDPELLLRNPFSDRFFRFEGRAVGA